MTATREADLPEGGKPLLTTVAIVASCLAFVVIGALQALYGPAIPALRDEFGISPAVAGLSSAPTSSAPSSACSSTTSCGAG